MNVCRFLRSTFKFHPKPYFLSCTNENGFNVCNRLSPNSCSRRNYVRRYEEIISPTSDSLLTRISERFNLFTAKYKHQVTGIILLESIIDNTDYARMIKKLNMPDTFYSWFVITELYIWMTAVRYMSEGTLGREVRNNLLEALWIDVKQRTHQLGAANPSILKSQILELSEQLNAALIAYDEGLQSSDAAFAGALWRRMYQEESVDPENLDLLVKYVRRQIKILDNLTTKQLFEERNFKFEPFLQ